MKRSWWKIGAFVSILPTLVLPTAAFAQLSEAVGKLEGTGVGPEGGGQNLPQLVGGIINVFIGLLGIIFVILVVYAGYLYMTAAGEEKKIQKAKNILRQAVIGLVIVLAAYAISNFVVGQLTQEITGAGSTQTEN